MYLDKDLLDFLESLNKEKVRYLIVGGVSVIIHGYARTTMDLDVWVERSEENYQKLQKAFADFGMPMFDMTRENFLENDDFDVFTFGRPPVCIDLMNRVKGLHFESAYENSQEVSLGDCLVKVVSKRDLIQAKLAAGRHKDLDDVLHLEKKDGD